MLKKILIALASLLVLVLVVGLVLPGTYRVERSTLIHAPPEVIHGLVADLERWKEWTPWRPETSAGTQWVFGGPRMGAGAVRSWNGEHGTGTLSLTQADPRMGVAYDTSLEDGHYLMHGRISFAPSDTGTRVTWVEEGSVGANPFMHYLLPLIQARLGTRFEEGLAQLQKRAEATPPPVEVKPVPVPAPVEQAAAPSTPPASAVPAPAGETASAPVPEGAPGATTPATPTATASAEAAPRGTAPPGAAQALDGGVASAPSPDATVPSTSAEKVPAGVSPPPSGTPPASASAAPHPETASETPAAGEGPPSAPASAPVAGQAVPPT